MRHTDLSKKLQERIDEHYKADRQIQEDIVFEVHGIRPGDKFMKGEYLLKYVSPQVRYWDEFNITIVAQDEGTTIHVRGEDIETLHSAKFKLEQIIKKLENT